MPDQPSPDKENINSTAPGNSTSDAPGYTTSDAPGYTTSDAPGNSTSDAPVYSTSTAPGFSKLTALALFIFFLPLLVLPFFNHPSTDDYFCGLHLNRLGIWNYQEFVYTNWGGRFAATFTGSLAAMGNFIFHNYYAHTLILLVLNILSLFFLVKKLNIQWEGRPAANSFVFFLSLLLAAVQYSCLPELSTFLFWYSSAVTYHLPVILLQFQLVLWLAILNEGPASRKFLPGFLLAISFFVITGFGELFIVLESFVLSGIFLAGPRRLGMRTFAVSIILFLLSTGILLASPGLLIRLSLISPKSPAIGVMSVLYQLGQVYFSVFSSSLFWIVAIMLFLTVTYNRNILSGKNAEAIRNTSVWKIWLAMVIFQVLVLSMVVLGLRGGVPPLRYVNVITWITGFSVLFIVIVIAFRWTSITLSRFPLKPVSLLLLVGLVFNNYTRTAYRDMVAAPAYNAVMKDREMKLSRAAQEGISTLSLPLVQSAYQAIIEKDSMYRYNSIRNLVADPPGFLFIQDDLEQPHTRKQLEGFYGLDSIIVQR